MQKIAAAVGFNETVFISPSDVADIKIRYFTPGHEVNLCGHGTVAALIALFQQKGISNIETVETKAGVIDARISSKSSGASPSVIMEQIPALFIEFDGDISGLASIIGLVEDDIETKWPIVYGSTGIWTLLVPIKTLNSFKRMSPDTNRFPEILTQNSRVSIHPFCLESFHSISNMHGRHFSSPYSGTVEDPVTGTASGVMGAYHLNYISHRKTDRLIIEQGQEINRNGQVIVNVKQSDGLIHVEIEGKGVFVKEIVLDRQDSI